MTKEEFEELVIDALAQLPSQFQKKLENVDLVIEDWPPQEVLNSLKIAKGATLFGLYRGIPKTKRGAGYSGVLPDKITIFRGPIEEICQTSDQIRSQVKKTVIHEIAHHFGISEGRLKELQKD